MSDFFQLPPDLQDQIDYDAEQEVASEKRTARTSKALFEMVYQWGKHHVVVDHTAPAFCDLITHLQEDTEHTDDEDSDTQSTAPAEADDRAAQEQGPHDLRGGEHNGA